VKLNLFLMAVLVALVAANFGLSDNPTHRNWEVMPEMVRTIAYKSFSANPNFTDGKTLQLPPEGAVPRDAAQSPARPGSMVYQIYCQPCHGGAGKGDGPVAMRGFPPPPSLLAEHAARLTDDQMFEILGRGQKNMPSYAVQVPPQDRRAAIAYIRSLQGGPQQ
jgi:mono/diheme cytochrome c family protein